MHSDMEPCRLKPLKKPLTAGRPQSDPDIFGHQPQASSLLGDQYSSRTADAQYTLQDSLLDAVETFPVALAPEIWRCLFQPMCVVAGLHNDGRSVQSASPPWLHLPRRLPSQLSSCQARNPNQEPALAPRGVSPNRDPPG
jgi:hypothetical protein